MIGVASPHGKSRNGFVQAADLRQIATHSMTANATVSCNSFAKI
jgi:hypothetical protein